jgi:hypothetical protein
MQAGADRFGIIGTRCGRGRFWIAASLSKVLIHQGY